MFGGRFSWNIRAAEMHTTYSHRVVCRLTGQRFRPKLATCIQNNWIVGKTSCNTIPYDYPHDCRIFILTIVLSFITSQEFSKLALPRHGVRPMLFPWQRNEELWVCINIAKHLIITFAYMKHTQTLKMFEYFRKIWYQDVTVWQGNALGGYVSFGPDHIKNIEVGDFLLPASDTSMFVAYNKMCSETEWRCLILYLFSRYVWALANNNPYIYTLLTFC